MRFVLVLIYTMLLLTIFCFPFIWVIRDGLGPGMTESSGLEAISKTLMTFYAGPLVGVLTIMALVLESIAWRRSRRHANTMPPLFDDTSTPGK